MTRFLLAAGVAALAITAPAAAGPHGGRGGGNGGGGHGGGHAMVQRGPAMQRGGGHGGGRAMAFAQPHGHAQGGANVQHGRAQRMANVDRGPAQHARAQRMANVQHGHTQRMANVQHGRGDKAAMQAARGQQQREQATARMNARMLGRNNNPVLTGNSNARVAANARVLAENGNPVGYGVGGCPPGLAKKAVACMPPGLAAKIAPFAVRNEAARAILAPAYARSLVGQPLSVLSDALPLQGLPVRLQTIYPTTPQYYYQYGNGYVYQVNRSNDLISALLPLFGAGYGVGQPFPSAYPYYGLPTAYQPFYPSSAGYDYRYANGYVYQIDPYTGMIDAVDPALGYGYGYGQIMPASYSAYNVPYQYRPYYYDTGDYYYRYAPGAIYQVDPTTSLITAVAALLSPNPLTVGQPLPMGYSAYNVPYAYRTSYYDTPDAWYRYSNGYIYRVDPATELVTALVASALT